MLRVGLTGGIGSGKSTVARLFAERGVPVIDTDEIARDLVAPGLPAHAEIAAAFGPSILNPDGTLNRAALRVRVFGDAQERRRLESILHPRIRDAVRERSAALRADYCIVVVPLLLEADLMDTVDRVLVVDTSEALQMSRTMARNALSEEEVRAIMTAQISRADRLAAADDIIRNDGELPALAHQVERLDAVYRALAHQQ